MRTARLKRLGHNICTLITWKVSWKRKAGCVVIHAIAFSRLKKVGVSQGRDVANTSHVVDSSFVGPPKNQCVLSRVLIYCPIGRVDLTATDNMHSFLSAKTPKVRVSSQTPVPALDRTSPPPTEPTRRPRSPRRGRSSSDCHAYSFQGRGRDDPDLLLP